MGGSVGRKLLISGKGRCNITNTIAATKDFVSHFGKNGRFLYQALNSFSTSDTVAFFNKRGMATKIDKDFKIFPPTSDMAEEVLSVLTRYLKENSVDIRQGVIIKNINTENNKIVSISTAHGDIKCKAVILATGGGKSYPKTGSTGDGYIYAKKTRSQYHPAETRTRPCHCKRKRHKKNYKGSAPPEMPSSLYILTVKRLRKIKMMLSSLKTVSQDLPSIT